MSVLSEPDALVDGAEVQKAMHGIPFPGTAYRN